MTISIVVSSNFSDLISKPLPLLLHHRIHSLLVPFFLSFSYWRFVPLIGSIALPWPLVRTFTKTLFVQQQRSCNKTSNTLVSFDNNSSACFWDSPATNIFPQYQFTKIPKKTMAKINTNTRSIISTPNQYCNTVAIMSPRVEASQPAVAGSKNKLLHPYQK